MSNHFAFIEWHLQLWPEDRGYAVAAQITTATQNAWLSPVKKLLPRDLRKGFVVRACRLAHRWVYRGLKYSDVMPQPMGNGLLDRAQVQLAICREPLRPICITSAREIKDLGLREA